MQAIKTKKDITLYRCFGISYKGCNSRYENVTTNNIIEDY